MIQGLGATRIAGVTLAAGLLISASLSAQATPPNVAGRPAAAVRARAAVLAHLSRQEIGAARTALDAGLRDAPNDAGLLEALGQLEWRMLHTASALRAFERATRDPVLGADAHLGLGRIFAFRGWQQEGAFPGWHEEVDQRPRALAEFRRAAELRPTWAAPHVALGEALMLDAQPDEALRAFERALALAPRDRDAARGRDRAAAALGRDTGNPAPPDAEQLALEAADASLKGGQAAEAARQLATFTRA